MFYHHSQRRSIVGVVGVYETCAPPYFVRVARAVESESPLPLVGLLVEHHLAALPLRNRARDNETVEIIIPPQPEPTNTERGSEKRTAQSLQFSKVIESALSRT